MREKAISTVSYSLFVLVVIGLIYTQLFRCSYYSNLSKNNSIRIVPINAPRGRIFDRNGELLATNRVSFDVAVVYQEIREKRRLADVLNDTLGISKQDVMTALKRASLKPFVPVTIVEDIDKDRAIALEEASFDMSGLVMETQSKRHYPYGDTASHLFGYLTEISEEELETLKGYGYRPKNLVGRAGLEGYYNAYLAGVDGGTQVEVDNKGRQTRILGFKDPKEGKDLRLTIDMTLQGTCDKLLGERTGAIIVMNPRDGAVLAISSHPPFDPNIFVQPSLSDERVKLLKDMKRHPLLNRAISGLYPPGSVFKIVTASAALESRRISPYTRFVCAGSYKLGNAKFDCWKEGGHGSQAIVDGLMNSCNVFFYHTGRAVGIDYLESCAKMFGFGKATGIDLPDEAKGLVPGRLWKRVYMNESWYDGDTLNYSIGQGSLLVTPIQVLHMMAVMANEGYLVRPYIVAEIDSKAIRRTERKRIALRDDVIQKVREGLFKVVNGENGTGRRAKVEGMAIAGKTGTAQTPQRKTHGWFSGFAPYDDPTICLVVFLEYGGKGGLEPAEIAKDIFKAAKDRGYL